MSRAVPSRHGGIVGRELARLADSQVVAHPEIPERCVTCAFREGTMPNMMAPTVLEAMRIVAGVESSMFGCHHHLEMGDQPHKVCAGYLLAMEATFEERKAAIGRMMKDLNAVTGSTEDNTDKLFLVWREMHDPEDKMDDYERANSFARFRRQHAA